MVLEQHHLPALVQASISHHLLDIGLRNAALLVFWISADQLPFGIDHHHDLPIPLDENVQCRLKAFFAAFTFLHQTITQSALRAAKFKRFAETGGPTPLLDLGGLTLTQRVYGPIAPDNGDASGTADLVFASTPTGPVMQAFGPGVGPTVTELGGTLDVAISGKVHLWAGYNGSFHNGARSHAAKATVTLKWQGKDALNGRFQGVLFAAKYCGVGRKTNESYSAVNGRLRQRRTDAPTSLNGLNWSPAAGCPEESEVGLSRCSPTMCRMAGFLPVAGVRRLPDRDVRFPDFLA